MKIQYATRKVERICTDRKYGVRFFGGNRLLFDNLLSCLAKIARAHDIVDLQHAYTLRLHRLRNKGHRNLEGYYAVDVKNIRDPWRLIIQFLDSNGEPFATPDIDVNASEISIVEIEEVSKHYE